MPAPDAHWYKDAIFYEVYVRGFQDSTQRRQRRPARPDREARLPARPGRRLPLADADLRVAAQGRRLRHRRFPQHPPDHRRRRGLRGPDRGGPRARHPHHRRPGPQPHVRPAPLVPGGAARSRTRRSATTTSGATPTRSTSGVRIIFTDTEHSNWTWDPIARQYYWHRFFSHQPDLNYDNPAVRRRDARRHGLLARPRHRRLPRRRRPVPVSSAKAPTARTCRRRTTSARRCGGSSTSAIPGTLLLAEANQWPERPAPVLRRRRRVPHGVQLPAHAADVHGHPPRASAGRSSRSWTRCRRFPPSCQWALFLRNHDELTLEMVTDEERDYMYSEYAKDPRMRLNLGIRRRLAPLMDNGRRQIELLHSLLFTLPGSPVLYYGDEIGMGDNIYLGDRNGVRTPMQWTGDRNAGFSRADPVAALPAGHPRSDLPLPGDQRRGPAALADVAAQLAAAADPRAQEVPGLRPRLARVRALREPTDRGLPARATRAKRSWWSTTSRGSPSRPSWTCGRGRG